jgi:hypothetical protein
VGLQLQVAALEVKGGGGGLLNSLFGVDLDGVLLKDDRLVEIVRVPRYHYNISLKAFYSVSDSQQSLLNK